MRNFSGDPAGLAGGFDSHFDGADSISRAYGDIGSATASVTDTEGLVTQFTFAPEPETAGLLLIGALVLVGRKFLRGRA